MSRLGEMAATEDLLIPYRLRTVRIGVQATYLVMVPLFVYGLLARRAVGPDDRVSYFALLVLGTAGAWIIGRLPWRKLFEAGRGFAVLNAWSVLDILLITMVVAITGGADSEMFLLYAFTTIFFAASYPLRNQISLFAFTFLSYLIAVEWAGTPLSAGTLILRMSLLGAFLFMASFLARELMEQMAAHGAASTESDRRAGLLETVASAAREMSVLGPEGVFEVVIGAVNDLGLEASNITLFDESRGTFRSIRARGLPEEYLSEEYPASSGVTGRVLNTERTLVVEDYDADPNAAPALRGLGFKAVISTPIWSDGRVAAVLTGGTRATREFTPQDIEAFELLAGQASRALENARRYEEQNNTVRRLSELDRLKQDFLTTVSHELRTPLTAIEGMGLTLEQRWDELPEGMRLELIHRLNANTLTLHSIVTTLLDFSRLEAGVLELQPADVRIDELVGAVIERLRTLLGDHALTVEIGAPIEVNGDAVLLDRVIENLLANAAKYTPPGTAIHVSIDVEKEDVVVAVADEGPGIPEHERVRLGELFFRGGDLNGRTVRGTGLGLALVKEILTLHGSSLDVVSQVGRGSTFSFRLPLLTQRTPV
ncbi:MAG: ATP-binding protein [Actinomycetota bacterium]|nr:ATP-binding protein [Actinomycetota bacterium]